MILFLKSSFKFNTDSSDNISLELCFWNSVLMKKLLVSLSLNCPDSIILNPFSNRNLVTSAIMPGLSWHEITASSLIKVKADGGIVDQGSTKRPINPAGFKIHSAIRKLK